MRSIRTLILASVFAVPAAPVLAQMYPGQGVIVNPWAIGAVPYRYGLEPIHLHMPVHRHVVHHHAAVAAATPAAAPTATAETSTPTIGTMADTTTPAAAPAAPPPKPTRHHKDTKTASAAPAAPAAAPPPATANINAGTGMDDAIPFSLDGVHTVPQKPATKTASTEPPPTTAAQPAASQPGMTKRGEILFTKNATDPAPAQFDGLKLLAGDLSEALKNGSSRIQLEAYAGGHGDKGSEARRLSLKRALSIRQVLIENGVPSSAIDVRAMGGADDSGPADRVDVYIRAG
jgi:outer membrane protein OmpA-like peptidoglycan-associated protein